MFFPWLRRHARWVFVLLALVFGVGFVAFGVGSGSSGLQDILGNFSLGGSSTSDAVSKARNEVKKHPNDPNSYRKLATALETKGDADGAVPVLEQYVGMKPKDLEAVRELAGLYQGKAQRLIQQEQALQYANQTAVGGSLFGPPASTKLGQALGTNAVNDAVSSQVNGVLTDLNSQVTTAYQKAVGAYRQIASGSRTDPTAQFQLGLAAEQARDYTTAILAYNRFVRLAPEDPTTPRVKQRIEQLKQQLAQQQVSSTPTG
jgi:tetratricopeptide (TPR) repeat protein